MLKFWVIKHETFKSKRTTEFPVYMSLMVRKNVKDETSPFLYDNIKSTEDPRIFYGIIGNMSCT